MPDALQVRRALPVAAGRCSYPEETLGCNQALQKKPTKTNILQKIEHCKSLSVKTEHWKNGSTSSLGAQPLRNAPSGYPLLRAAPGATGGLGLHGAPLGVASCGRKEPLQLSRNRISISNSFGYFFFCVCVCPIQNSPELDEEGYSIRPEEPGYILYCWLCLSAYKL